ncbi:MAG: LuxR C-terminal-related transcriptional regulator [Candidatus Cohnella colombiensis]|uniref:LuxR C-terminal-related transcriptional regulator n=1 Tax=Candidatus Cohnella colombiensis TaxID=3121368 RepID=A0AA95F0L5_9BACL|nr:MAG: LuxR C-terminal-related transcriptional regulator [Cohnella sp.]
MSISIVSTKLSMPAPRAKNVNRPRLIERLNDGIVKKLTLVSASAGYGKTTLVGGWLATCGRPAVWLSLDQGDNDSSRFMNHFIAALRTMDASIGEGFGDTFLHTHQSAETVMAALINELQAVTYPFVFVMDDYHIIESDSIHKAIGMLIERMPSHMHMIIATRQNPPLSLARLRVRNELMEVRATDLQFTHAEAAEFLSEVMELQLAPAEVDLLESRTEGWAAGLQLAALSLQGRYNTADFINSFTGNHSFVLDYLLEEVLLRQPIFIQAFLLRTSILDRMCSALCDALLSDMASTVPQGQETLELLERANLFIIPLDNERRWYRYHHLFADLLRQRLLRGIGQQPPDADPVVLHSRASLWHEEQGDYLEAFQHAVSAQDVERAAILVEGNGIPLHFRGTVTPVCHWLDSLPKKELDKRPQLWVIHGSVLIMMGRMSEVESKLSAAERALQGMFQDDHVRDWIGHIAATRATIAVSRHKADEILTEATRALQYLHSDNLPVRTAANWALGFAHQLRGDRVSAAKAYQDAQAASLRIGHVIIAVMSTLGLASIQEDDNLLHTAADTYRKALQLAGNPPLPVACAAYLGLARICYQRNDLEEATQLGQQAIRLAGFIEHTDQLAEAKLFMARMKLAHRDNEGAAILLAEAKQAIQHGGFEHLAPLVVELHTAILHLQGDLAVAAQAVKKDSKFSDLLLESLSEKETEVLQLIADGLSNREISERLHFALSTVKGYNRIIFDKLQVKRRTEAVARARSLGLIK